jgi:hypothetical protein
MEHPMSGTTPNATPPNTAPKVPAPEGEKKTQKAARAKAGGIRIISRKEGLRRAGVVHTGDATHPADAFTPEQVKLLKAEPLLTVIETAGETEAE